MKIVLIMIICIYSLYADKLPAMAFLGYNGDAWVVCLTKSDGSVKEIVLEQEAHAFDYNFKRDEILYIGENGKLRLYSKGSERELNLPYKKSAYTQPSFSCKKDFAYAVELIDKNSKSTQIVSIDLRNDSLESVVKQTSSQFEASEIDAQRLLFTNLICNRGCAKLIQEIWKKNRVTGESEQLTLLNSFSSNPSVQYNDNWIFFSSNKNGTYHIWAKNLDSSEASLQITEGDYTDSFPASLGRGSFLYLRQNKNRNFIMYGDINRKFYKIKLLKEYNKIRQLKVNRCKQ
ncbi:MAG: hypothetical protein DRG78_23290 [Epsilonproteobacteria bacterium]|nr:MAG: hypothetical protein DRG78_23290 [Campylobacterota bacterium]